MDKKLLVDIATNAIDAIMKEIDAVTSDDDMNYIVTAVMAQLGLWIRH